MNISERSEQISSISPRKRGNISEPRRVLTLSHIYPPAIDGGSQIIYKLVSVLRKKEKIETKILTSDAYSTDDFVSRKEERINQNKKKNIIRVRTIRRPGRLIRRITGPVFLGFPWLKIIKWNPDVIIGGPFPTTMPIYAWILSKLTRAELRIVPCTHHNFDNFNRFPLIPILKRADLIYSLSREEKKVYRQNYGIKAKKIEVFRPPVDNQLLVSSNEQVDFPKTPTILFLGNHAAHKRIIMLIKAFSIVKDLKLVIAGRRTLYTPEIEKIISNLPQKVRSKIELLGEYDRQKEAQLLDQATVLVNPSRYEALGLVFMEAWARKKPVIAADLPTLKEVIDDGQDGLLFKKNSLDDLSDKIKMIIENPELAREMGERGYEKVVNNYL